MTLSPDEASARAREAVVVESQRYTSRVSVQKEYPRFYDDFGPLEAPIDAALDALVRLERARAVAEALPGIAKAQAELTAAIKALEAQSA